MLNTLPNHPQTHFQQLSSLTQRQQRPGNNHKSQKTGVLHCQCHSQPLLLAVIFEFLNSNLLVLCSAHPQHIRKHICNSFPHLHNVNRGLETSTNREKQVFTLSVPQSGVATSRYFWICEFKFACFVLNTLPTHPQTHLQQLSSLTQHQQRPGNKHKSRQTVFRTASATVSRCY